MSARLRSRLVADEVPGPDERPRIASAGPSSWRARSNGGRGVHARM